MFKQLQTIPWFIRIPLGAVVFFGAMYLLLRLWVGNAIEDAIDNSPDEITYESIFLKLNGDFGIVNVKGKHPLPDGKAKAYSADRVVVHTPGLLWLARVGWKGESGELPDDIGFTVENVRLDDDSGNDAESEWSNLPFEAVGCGKRKLTRADMAGMGFSDLKRNVTLRLTRLDDHASMLRFAADTPGVGGTAMEIEIGIERPLVWEQGPQGLIGARIKSGAVNTTDHGFIAARNAYCAKAAGIEPAAFVAHHLQKLDTHLAEEGVTLGVGAMDRSKEFVAKGGELSVVTVGDTKLTIGDFAGPDRVGKMAAVRTGVRHNGGPLANFEVGTQPRIARVDPEPAAAVAAPVALAPGAAAAVLPAAAPPTVIGGPAAKPAPASMQPADTLYNRTRSDNLTGTETRSKGRVVATGDVIPYASLDKHIGERVQITTKMGSVRHGTVASTNTYQTSLKLDAEEGGFNLNIFADTVAEVRLIPATN